MTRCLRACASASRAGGSELIRSSSEVSSTSSRSSGEKVASTVAKSISEGAAAAVPAAPPPCTQTLQVKERKKTRCWKSWQSLCPEAARAQRLRLIDVHACQGARILPQENKPCAHQITSQKAHCDRKHTLSTVARDMVNTCAAAAAAASCCWRCLWRMRRSLLCCSRTSAWISGGRAARNSGSMLSPSSWAAAAEGAAWLVLLEEGPTPPSPACASALPVQQDHL